MILNTKSIIVSWFFFPVNIVAQWQLIAVNIFDRLTSGSMITPLSAERACLVTDGTPGTVRVEYIPRVTGRFLSYDQLRCSDRA